MSITSLDATRVSLTANGYWIQESGLILQWGNAIINPGPSDTIITLPMPFPSAFRSAQVTPAYPSASGVFVAQVTAISLTTLSMAASKITAGAVTQPGCEAFWLAVGY